MPATYEPIATTTLGSAATNITFSSIPATYTDLRLVLVARSDRAINSIVPVWPANARVRPLLASRVCYQIQQS